jgi:hypothetical protein
LYSSWQHCVPWICWLRHSILALPAVMPASQDLSHAITWPFWQVGVTGRVELTGVATADRQQSMRQARDKEGEIMLQRKMRAGRTRAGLITLGTLVVLLGLAMFGAPGVSADDSGAGTLPPGTLPPFLETTITFIHAAPLNADPDLTAVDICATQSVLAPSPKVVPGLEDLVFGEARTLTVTPGTFDFLVAEAGTNCGNVLVNIAPFNMTLGSIKVLVITGDNVNQPLQVLDVTQREGGAMLFLPLVGHRTTT